MLLQPERFERKTFVVEAVQVSLENMPEVIAWCGGTLQKDDLHRPYIAVDVRRPANQKQTMAYEGDWVLKAGTGFRIYTDHAFWKSFERTDKPVGYGTNDPYQTGNVFERPGVDRKVVVEKPVGDEKLIQGESVETVVETLDLGDVVKKEPKFEVGHPGEGPEQGGFVTRPQIFRTPEELRKAHETGYVFSDGTPVKLDDLIKPVASDGRHETYLEQFYAEHGHYPGENPDNGDA